MKPKSRKTPACVLVTTTIDRKPAADALAAAVVAARLAACVQCMPIRSVYRWKDKTEKGGEVLLLMKTRKSLAGRLMTFVKARHPYEVPELVVLPIQNGLPAYLQWIADETGEVADA